MRAANCLASNLPCQKEEACTHFENQIRSINWNYEKETTDRCGLEEAELLANWKA